MRRVAIAIAFAMAVGACTHTGGRKFASPPPDGFALGTTTIEQIRGIYGVPVKEQSTLNITKNPNAPDTPIDPVAADGNFTFLQYVYVEVQAPILGGGEAIKTLFFSFRDTHLYAYGFTSSFAADYRPLDQSAVNQIVKGTTTRAQVTALFGNPTGHATYPAVHDVNEDKYIYTSVQRDTENSLQTVKHLQVLFTTAGIVRDVKFDSDTGPLPINHGASGGSYMAPIFIPMKK